MTRTPPMLWQAAAADVELADLRAMLRRWLPDMRTVRIRTVKVDPRYL